MKLIQKINYDVDFYSINIFDINESIDRDLIAISNNINKGEFLLKKINIENNHVIRAHGDKISFLKFNYTGTIVATISETGKVIKLFNTYTKEKIRKFRRGMDNAIIRGINFSLFSEYFAIISNKGTIHIWEIEYEDKKKLNKKEKLKNFFKMGGERNFKEFKIKNNDSGKLVFTHDNVLQIYTMTNILYKIDYLDNECKLKLQSKILPK